MEWANGALSPPRRTELKEQLRRENRGPSRRRSDTGQGRPESPHEKALTTEKRVELALRDLDVKIEMARPRVVLESAVRDLLRDDQRARGFGRRWGLLSFRGQDLR